MILFVLLLVCTAEYVVDIQQLKLVENDRGEAPQIFFSEKFFSISSEKFWKCGNSFCPLSSVDNREGVPYGQAQDENQHSDTGSDSKDVDLLQEHEEFQFLYEFFRFVSQPQVQPENMAYFLMQNVAQFTRIRMLFSLWERALQRGDLFSHSLVTHRESVDLRFGKKEGFFSEVFEFGNLQSLLEHLMRSKLIVDCGAFDVFVSIFKFVIQKGALAMITQQTASEVSSHAFQNFCFIYSSALV